MVKTSIAESGAQIWHGLRINSSVGSKNGNNPHLYQYIYYPYPWIVRSFVQHLVRIHLVIVELIAKKDSSLYIPHPTHLIVLRCSPNPDGTEPIDKAI